MLDKSITYKNVIMRMEADKVKNIEDPVLPGNYRFRYFKDADDIRHWGKIETSVIEFDEENTASDYFRNSYYPYLDELKKRCIFIVNESGLPVATSTAWFSDSELGHQANLHWVAVNPKYQGQGLGRAVTQKALTIFKEMEPNNAVWLHTQTWSYPAIKLYHDLGFNIVKTEKLANSNPRDMKKRIYPNDYEEAIPILKEVMKKDFIERLVNSAV